MKISIIGLPQAGKREAFSLLTSSPYSHDISRSGLVGMANIRDKRLEKLSAIYQPKKTVPGTLEFLLLPSLEKPGQNGPILREIANSELICYVVRAFEDETVFHVDGSVDPVRDLEWLNNELILADMIFLEKRLENLSKDKSKGKKKSLAGQLDEEDLLKRANTHLEDGKPLSSLEANLEEMKLLRETYRLLTAKPVLLVLNIVEDDIGQDLYLAKVKTLLQHWKCMAVEIAIKLEEELSNFDSIEERQEFLTDYGIEQEALEKLTISAYHLLGRITFFTVGKDEVRAWMIPKDSLAPRAARAVHRDIERGFIRAEVMKYEDFMQIGSAQGLKEAGKYYVKGKDYQVEDGDIINYLFKV